MGKPWTPEHKLWFSNLMKGNTHRRGKPASEETRKKISKGLSGVFVGRKLSVEHIEKIRQSQLGRKRSKESRLKQSLAMRGRPKSTEWRKQMSERQKGNRIWLGKRHKEETKQKMSESWKRRDRSNLIIPSGFHGAPWTIGRRLLWSERKKGAGNNNWKNGITKASRLVRNTWQYRLWSVTVRKRDGKCLQCGSSENLHAHHKLEFSKHIELRFELENGITLCAGCHLGLHHGPHDLEERSVFT